MHPAQALVDLARSRPATLGAGRLVCIDGPAGSGKTTLAAEVADRAPEARVLHMDDVYEGWDGLPLVVDQLARLLRPLARGEAGCYRRYDWYAGDYAERVVVPGDRGLVLEGVGAGNAGLATHATVLVWVEAPPEVCDARWLARDGELARVHGPAWRQAEAALFAREHTRERADLVISPASNGPR